MRRRLSLVSISLAATLALTPTLTSASDPCAPIAPLDPDPAEAALYRAVAEAELARGARATAAVAFRAAAARDPSDASSRAALARLCAEAPGPDPFAEGVARLDAGDARGALAAFRAARGTAAPSPALALLEGICLVDLGREDEAEPLLRLAERAPAQRDAARLWLGVLKLRAGDAAGAAALLDAAGSAPGVGRVASDLARLARRDRRLVVSLLAESSWDSNVTLAPAGAVPGPEADGTVGLTAAALWRPRGASGPYLRAAAGATEMLQLGAYDFAALDGAVGWQVRRPGRALALQYDAAVRALGGERYLVAHRVLASALAGRRVTFGVAASARLEDYAGAYADFSGVLLRGEARLGLPVGSAARLGLGYGVSRDLAEAEDLSFLEHGPRTDLWIALGRRVRLGLEAGAALRAHDAADALLGEVREDVLLDGTATAEWDLGASLTLRLALHARRNVSTIDALEYEKLVPSLGLLWVTGLP